MIASEGTSWGSSETVRSEAGMVAPILVISKDNQDLLTFTGEAHFLEHSGGHKRSLRATGEQVSLFADAQWDIFDSTGRLLRIDRATGKLEPTQQVEPTEGLKERILRVVEAVRVRGGYPEFPAARSLDQGVAAFGPQAVLYEAESMDFVDLVRSIEALGVGDHPVEEDPPTTPGSSGLDRKPPSGDPGSWWHYMWSPHH